MGYQANYPTEEVQSVINKFINLNINNIGDPFRKGDYSVNSKDIQYGVLKYYSQLWNFKQRNMEIDKMMIKQKPNQSS